MKQSPTLPLKDPDSRPPYRHRLGDILIGEKFITQEQLDAALNKQKTTNRKLGELLVDMGFISQQDILSTLSRVLKLPLINVNRYQFVYEVARLLPEAYARRYRAVLLEEQKNGYLLGLSDPLDVLAIDKLTQVLRKPVNVALVNDQELGKVFDLIYRRTEEITSLATALGDELAENEGNIQQLIESESTSDAPVVRLLQTLFRDAVQIGASDIHIEPEETILRIRQRVDGVLQEQILDQKRIALSLVARIKLMSGLDIAEKRLPQDGRFTIRVENKVVNVRVSTLPVQFGESVVMRLHETEQKILSLEELGMEPSMLTRFRQQINRHFGMVLVTGPTGSGKSTTLYAALSILNEPDTKIITVEDPVESRLHRINQVQVNPKIDLDFARVLRAVLRQDPDVLMIGEMRDRETMEIGIRSAMTGHLVLSTLHTNNAITTVNRLLDMGAAGYMLAASLNAVVAQQLVRRICESCVAPAELTAGEKSWLRKTLGEEPNQHVWKRGTGCVRCNNTGYKGRIGLYELLVLDDDMTEALRVNNLEAFAHAAHSSPGFQPLLKAGLAYASQGVTTIEEVLRVAGTLGEDAVKSLSG